MTDDMDATTTAGMELYLAQRYAESGDWQAMYQHIWSAMQAVPEEARVGWEYRVRDTDARTAGEGVGMSHHPIEQLQSVLYEHNQAGVVEFSLRPAGWENDE